jgi:hypothetical protein
MRAVQGWVKLGTGLAVVGAQITESVLHPTAALALGIADAAIPLIVGLILFTTIVWGRSETVERAFRLLRWIANRPEPGAPDRPSSQSPASAEHPSAGITDIGPDPTANPGLSAGRLVAAAARLLPVRERARYAEEFRAELWEIAQAGGRRAQLAYAVRQVMAAWRLSAELRVPRRRGAAP